MTALLSHRDAGMRNFILIWLGQMVSGVGTRLSAFALGIWVLHETKSTFDFSMIFVSMSLPALVLLPFAGALVDRWDRRRTMAVCEFMCAVITAGLAILLAQGKLALVYMYAGVALSAIANAFFQPAYAASVPLLTTQDNFTRVNGLIQTGGAIALVGGPLLAGILVNSIGVSGILLVDAATFVVGGACLLMAKVPSPVREDNPDSHLLSEALEGWRYVCERQGLFGLLIVFGITNFFFGIASIAITPLVLSMTSPLVLGYQMTIAGVGLLVGGALVSVWGGPKHKIHGVLGFSMLSGLALAAHGLYPSIVLIMVLGFLLFLTMPVINATNATLWQTKVPTHLQGRTFAILRIMTEAAMPVGYLLAGPLAEFVFEPALMPGGALADSVGAVIGVGHGRGLGLMFIVLGVLMMLVAAAGYCVRSIRRIDEDLPDVFDTPSTAAAAV